MARRVIDADGHLMERDTEIHEYLDAPYRDLLS